MRQMSANVCAAWQHPFVSIFKLCDVDTWAQVGKEGNVIAVLVRAYIATCPYIACHWHR